MEITTTKTLTFNGSEVLFALMQVYGKQIKETGRYVSGYCVDGNLRNLYPMVCKVEDLEVKFSLE